jgi:sialic acid synthase SpsE
MKAVINGTEVDQNKKVYIVLEAGPTHFGLDSAKKLAKLAKDSGADAIKFQFLYANRLMADKTMKFKYQYLKRDERGNEQFIDFEEPLYDILKRRELKKEEWKELKKYCDDIRITFFSTATYKEEVDFLVNELDVKSIKINSSDIGELELIKYCAKKGINIQLDTGNADIFEVEKAVIAAEEEGCNNIVIHLCPTGYPARLESLNLRMIRTLKTMFPNYSIAFSDHSPGWEMDIAAIAIGADMVEKTITLDKTIKSCEHSFSLEEDEIKKFVKSVRDLEIALGNQRRVFPKDVKEKRRATRRSPYALTDLREGERIKKEDFEFKRPGFGITSEEFSFFLNRILKKGIKKGEKITYEHI